MFKVQKNYVFKKKFINYTLLIIHIRYEIFLQSLQNILMSDHNSTALLSDMEFSSGGN